MQSRPRLTLMGFLIGMCVLEVCLNSPHRDVYAGGYDNSVRLTHIVDVTVPSVPDTSTSSLFKGRGCIPVGQPPINYGVRQGIDVSYVLPIVTPTKPKHIILSASTAQ